MTIDDQVAVLFARENPVPSLDLFDPIEPMDIDALTRSERSSEMTDVETIHPTKENRQRWPRVALGLAMAVIAVVALGFLFNRQSAVASPEAVAMAYLEAMNDQDLAAVEELVARDANVFDGLSELPARWDYERATGWVFPPIGCDEQSTSSRGTLLACRYSNDGSWMRALGLQPEVARDFLLIRDGQVHSVAEDENNELPNVGEAFAVFRDWVLENHNEDEATMYGPSGPLYTSEAIALWEQYTDEFVAEMEASG